MKKFTAVIKKDGNWWLGWVKEISGAVAQERTKEEVLVSLKEAVSDVLELRNQEVLNLAENGFEEVPLVV